MKTRILGNFFLLLIVSLTAACGSGDSSDKDNQYVEITSAFRCAISVSGPGPVPDNCRPEKIEGGSYVTDQNTIHLSGTSPNPEDDGCPEPTNFDEAFIPCGGSIFPLNYQMRWTNSTNSASGNGQVWFVRLFYGSVAWSTYDVTGVTIGYADPNGIPLKMGSNRVQVTTTNSGLNGDAEITITRVVDVTPPTVHSVNPEPGGTESVGGIVIYFSEHLDPASVITAISVVDENNQPVAGTSEYDPLKLKVVWLPQLPLTRGSSYIARIAGVTDWAPNVMIDTYEWSFTTQP
jgi:hypothetical protein